MLAAGEPTDAAAAEGNLAALLLNRGRTGAEPLLELAMTSPDQRVRAISALNLGVLQASRGEMDAAMASLRASVAAGEQEKSRAAASTRRTRG